MGYRFRVLSDGDDDKEEEEEKDDNLEIYQILGLIHLKGVQYLQPLCILLTLHLNVLSQLMIHRGDDGELMHAHCAN